MLFRNCGLLVAFTLAVAGATPVAGQGASAGERGDNVARLVAYRLKPGHDAQFEAGYRRHLEWHRQHNDPWAWLGWSFINGPRSGWFMDGTFGHSWAHLDQSVAPEEDLADNIANVDPHADLMENAVYQLDDRLSREPAAILEAPILSMVTVEVEPGGQHAFEVRLAGISRPGNAAGLPPAWAVLRLVSGGTPDRYLIMIAGSRVADVAMVGAWIDRVSGRGEGPGTALPIRDWQVETLLHRPDMSYRPGKP